MTLCPECGYYGNQAQCQLAPKGPDHKRLADARVKEIEWAYLEMKKRGWGFVSNGQGFGDPVAKFTMVGPYDGTLVEGLAIESDAVEAVREAIKRVQVL